MVLQIITFYSLTFLFTFIVGGIQQATGLNANISLPQWGPGIAALLTVLLFRKKVAKPNFALKGWTLREVVMGILIPIGASLVILFLTQQFVAYDESTPNLPWALLLWIPLGALGEELGWRGFLQANLDRGLAGWLSCLVVGLLWVPFHIQLLQNGAVYILFFALLLIANTTVLYILMRSTGFNVWIAALFHAAINYGNLLYYNAINLTRFMMINALVWSVIALIFVLLNRKMFFAKQTE